MFDHPSILRLAAGLAAVMVLVLTPPLAAEKTDVVVLANGDRITGEVKKLERGKLTFKTDAIGTLEIDWKDVASVRAGRTFDVELRTGERFLGPLAPAAEEGKLEVAGEEQSWTLDLPSVVRLSPIEQGFWRRVNGYLDLGFSFTEADDRVQGSFGAEAGYRTPKYLRRLRLSSVVTSQRGVDETTNRGDLSLYVTRFLRRPRRQFLGLATAQRNEELGLDLRALAGGAFGWSVIQNNTEILTLLAGAAVSREQLMGSDLSQESVEALLALDFESFKFDTPKRDVGVQLAVFPSVSPFGRVRAELSAKVSWEIVSDFFFSLTVLESFDSEPLTGGPAKTDLTLTTSLGWSF